MKNVLEIKNLKKSFGTKEHTVTAVNAVSFSVAEGECLGLVGESGCGKSTIARMITRMADADSGTVLLKGNEIQAAVGAERRNIYRQVQMVFQTPQDSFDPRRTLGDSIVEGIVNWGVSRREVQNRLSEMLSLVGLDESVASRYPHQVSGGQCQRAAIARALMVGPSLLICDEATSALDVTVQAQIMELLKKLRRELGLAILFICHDLALVQEMCDRTAVMYDGRIVECGVTDELLKNPGSAYTKMLLEAVL